MAEPRKMKLYIQDAVMAALRRDGKAKLDVLTASLALETGFRKKTIADILKDMVKVGKIEITNNIVTIKD